MHDDPEPAGAPDRFVRVAPVTEVGGPPYVPRQVGARTVRLARLDDGSIVAFGPACPHLHQPLTHAVVTGRTLECPFHFYAYDLTTGCNTFPGELDDLALPTYPVELRDGDVYVAVPEDHSPIR